MVCAVGLVYSIPHTADSIEKIIQRIIEGAQRMIRVNNSQGEEPVFLHMPMILRWVTD